MGTGWTSPVSELLEAAGGSERAVARRLRLPGPRPRHFPPLARVSETFCLLLL
jgi:hypothetical protein